MTFFLKLPLADIGGCVLTQQSNGRCQDFEIRYVECMEAYGVPMGFDKCKALYEDFLECNTQAKQMARVDAMRAERKRQYWAGERTKENLYKPPPNPEVL